MATTQKGIYYPDDYTAVADVPEDMKKQAESVDTALGNIEDTIEQDIQTQIDNIEEEQTTQNNEITALQTENTRLKATIPTTTGSGENVTLSNTAELEFIQPPLPRGNSEQVQYSGKQLFPMTNQDFTLNNVRYHVENGSLFLDGTSTGETSSLNNSFKTNFGFTLPAGNYVLSHKTSLFGVYLYNEDGTKIKELAAGTASSSFSLSEETNVFIGFYVYNKSFDNYNAEIQIEQGSTATAYEPYVGGTASPNPSYPQAITNVTGDVEVLLQNKNRLDISKSTLGKTIYSSGTILDSPTSSTTDYIDVSMFETFTMVVTDTTSSWNYCYFDENKNVVSGGANGVSSQSVTITRPLNVKYVRFRYATDGTGAMLVGGSTAGNYVLHKEQTLPLTLGNIELCKIGDYQDYFYKENNKWYLYKAINKLIIDENLTITSNTNYRFDINVSDTKFGSASNPNVISNCYISNFATTNGSIFVSGNYHWISIMDNRYNISNINLFKAWLIANDVDIYYVLNTPTITEITDTTLIEQLEAISNALSYEEQTSISGTSDEANPIFSVEAYQSIKLILAS